MFVFLVIWNLDDGESLKNPSFLKGRKIKLKSVYVNIYKILLSNGFFAYMG
jgi:hypothetical protein